MDWIGFLISIVALIYLFFKNANTASPEVRPNEEEVRPEDILDNPLSELLKATEAREHRFSPPSKPQSVKKTSTVKHERLEERHLTSSLKDKRLISAEEHRQLQSPLKSRKLLSTLKSIHEHEEIVGPPRAKAVLNRLHHKQDILIYHEIFGKPKSLQDHV